MEDLIRIMKKDKRLIDDKHLEREEKFRAAIETYRRSVNRELETFKYHDPKINNRNEEFRAQIKNIYYKYFTDSFKLLRLEKKLTEERLRFSEYFQRNAPNITPEVKFALQKEGEKLSNALAKLKDIAKNNVNPLKGYENYRREVENYLRLKNETKQRKKVYSHIQSEVENLGLKEISIENHEKFLEAFQKKYKDSRKEEPQMENLNSLNEISPNFPNFIAPTLYAENNVNDPPKPSVQMPEQKTNYLDNYMYNKKNNNKIFDVDKDKSISFPMIDKKNQIGYSPNSNYEHFSDDDE